MQEIANKIRKRIEAVKTTLIERSKKPAAPRTSYIHPLLLIALATGCVARAVLCQATKAVSNFCLVGYRTPLNNSTDSAINNLQRFHASGASIVHSGKIDFIVDKNGYVNIKNGMAVVAAQSNTKFKAG